MQNFSLNILDLLILFGALQGIILGIILLCTKKLSKRSNQYLAILLITFASLNIEGTLAEMGILQKYVLLAHLPFFWMTLIPVSLYYFLLYLIHPEHKFGRTDWIICIPFFLEFIHRLIRFFNYLIGLGYNEEQNLRFYMISNVFELIAVIGTIIIIINASGQLKTYEKNLYENYAEIEERSLNWLRITLLGGLVLSIFWFVLNISDFVPSHYDRILEYAVWIGLSILIYWVGYSMIIRQDLLDSTIFAISSNQVTKSNNTELSAKTEDHYVRLKKLIEEEELYKNPNFSLSILSERTGLSNGYLSQIINQKQGQNFFDFINGYRIEEVKKNLADPSFAHYSLLGLAQEAGFKSKSTFNAVFKKFNGMTPSEYKKSVSDPSI